MKIALTGATGFIGRHVLACLMGQDVEIVAVTREAGRLAGLDARVRVVELDIAHPPENAYEQLGTPDILMHLAWGGLPNYNSSHHFEAELPMHYRFLKGLVDAGLSHLLVTGTCFEYGMQSGPLSASLETRPSNPYGFAKDALRKQLGFLKRDRPFHLTWARLFYMYGQGQSSGSLYSQLQKAVESGDDVFNMSGGEQLRDYLPIEDVAADLVRLAILKRDVGPINLCSGTPISVRQLVESWLTQHGWSIALNLGHYPYPEYEPMAFWGDRQPLDDLLGRS